MTHYRLYRLDGTGRIAAAEWLEAETDGAAIEASTALKKAWPCELWDRNRFVAKIPAFGLAGEASL